jgi:hypothetical protein
MELLQKLIERVEYLGDTIRIRISRTGLSTALGCAPASKTDAQRDLNANERDHDIVVPIAIRKRSNELKLVIEDGAPRSGEPDPTLIQALVQAHLWWRRLQSGAVRTPADIAREEGISRSHISRMMRLAFLSPDITEAILAGTQPPELTLRRLLKAIPLPLHWHEQRRALRFTAPAAAERR